jgi:hypothetical protein
MMMLPGVNYDEGMWLFTTKEAYTQYRPWWMSLFSFGLLNPIPSYLPLRFVPLIETYNGPVDSTEIGPMSRMWLVLDSLFGADPMNLIAWMANESDEEDHWYRYTQKRMGEFERSELDLMDNKALFLALIFSFVLGLVGAVAGIIGCWMII